MDTTVCEGDSATFTCVVFIQSDEISISPGWLRNGSNVDMIRHIVMDNRTNAVPEYIGSTITVSNVTLFDDGVLYQCGILVRSNSATLNVVGKCIFCVLY